MTFDHADKLLEWKNYFETRKFSILTPDYILKEDHYKWLKENIQYFSILEDEGEICGAFRIENNEISIWIDKKFWRRGIATYTLQHIAKRGMIARIVEGNIGSMKAFIRAGFEPVDYIPMELNAELEENVLYTHHENGYYTFKKW